MVGACLTRVPLRDWAHDLDAMARIAADIIYLVNPHNPTGTVRSRAEIEHFVQASPAGLIVVDEAYVEFTDDPDATTCLPLVASGQVAVLRTFSKIHGLAGLRVGYLIADPGIITTLRKIRAPFSVGTLAQAGALAALGDPGHAAQVRVRTLLARAELTRLFGAPPATRSSPRRPTSSSCGPQTSTRWSLGSPSTPSPCVPAPRSASPARSGSACPPSAACASCTARSAPPPVGRRPSHGGRTGTGSP